MVKEFVYCNLQIKEKNVIFNVMLYLKGLEDMNLLLAFINASMYRRRYNVIPGPRGLTQLLVSSSRGECT